MLTQRYTDSWNNKYSTFFLIIRLVKQDVDEKLLKRQARFGIVTTDEIDSKKQKRAERFGANTNNSTVVVGANDEQKRKRAERFGLWIFFFHILKPASCIDINLK
jgi:gamma-glutamyl phosphate reductase